MIKILKYMTIGLKAFLGSVLSGIIMWILVILTAMFAVKSLLFLAIMLILVIVNVYVVGLIYHKLWGWK